MSAHQITLVWEIFANRTVTAIQAVWLTNDVYAEHVDQFATAMHHVEADKCVKIVYVKLVAVMI